MASRDFKRTSAMKDRRNMSVADAKAEFYIKSNRTNWNTIEKKYRAMIKTSSAYKAPQLKKAYKVLLKEYGKKKIGFDDSKNKTNVVPYEPRRSRDYNKPKAKADLKKPQRKAERDYMRRMKDEASARSRRQMTTIPGGVYLGNRTDYFKNHAELYGNPRIDPTQRNKRKSPYKGQRTSRDIMKRYNTLNRVMKSPPTIVPAGAPPKPP